MTTNPEPSLARFLESPTRFLFFTGKGGVGKTSLACAAAIALADRGWRVLLVSTDPASNLDEVLGVKLTTVPTEIPGVPRLAALNIDPAAAAAAYREKLVGPYRGKLPDAIVRSMEEQLSGACTMEIAAFDEFSRLLGQPEATADFDHVIFDTAPTGHTLRLLSLPGAWTGFFENNTTGNSCLGPLAGLEKQRVIYEKAVASLADARLTALVLVSRAQRAALTEAERTSNELAAIGVRNQRLILNGLFQAVAGDPVALALQQRGQAALAAANDFLKRMPVTKVALRSFNLVGIPALRALVAPPAVPVFAAAEEANGCVLPPTESLSELVDELAQAGNGVVMTMGKGGVGKTTIAAAIATELVRRGHQVYLSTTDPAAHIAVAAGKAEGLYVSRIDPQAETRSYVEQVMATAGKNLDANGRALLEEDLRSPCTEEIAVFRAFARTVAQGKDAFVVLDTAPTGHTLLLLDATESYHREIARKASDLPEEVQQLLPRLRDADYTRVLVVTLPEATPVHEAASLQEDLRRAHIEPFGWVINQSFAESGSRDPLLVARGNGEVPFIREVTEKLSQRTALVPWVTEEPAGPERLQQFFETATQPI
ncbi:MAG TPA: arsenical pump-driving ATPase [Candidatus Limnocylindrales bacterium]|nr:arsenical pump-driving ATPase [Candidatus Limnocylindrales bacterium]